MQRVSLSAAANKKQVAYRSLATESSSELKIFGLDGDSLGVLHEQESAEKRKQESVSAHDGSQVCVFKERDEVRLSGFLQSHDGGRLEAEIGLEVLSDFTDEALEANTPNKESASD